MDLFSPPSSWYLQNSGYVVRVLRRSYIVLDHFLDRYCTCLALVLIGQCMCVDVVTLTMVDICKQYGISQTHLVWTSSRPLLSLEAVISAQIFPSTLSTSARCLYSTTAPPGSIPGVHGMATLLVSDSYVFPVAVTYLGSVHQYRSHWTGGPDGIKVILYWQSSLTSQQLTHWPLLYSVPVLTVGMNYKFSKISVERQEAFRHWTDVQAVRGLYKLGGKASSDCHKCSESWLK